MTQATRRSIRLGRRQIIGDRSQFHYDTAAEMLVFADLHKAHAMRSRAAKVGA